MRLFFLLALCSTAAMAKDIGVYGPADPALHAALMATPGVRAYDVVAYTKCAPADVACLGGVARRAGMDSVVTLDGRLLREVSADGALVSQRQWPLAAPAAAVSAAPVATARSQAARVLLGSGVALLAGAAGTALYATYGGGSAASSIAGALAVTGAGALVFSGLVVALTPSGAMVSGSF